MAYMVSTCAHYHWVKKVTASTHGNGALKLTLHGETDASDVQFNEADITIFTDDIALTARLVEAINSVSRAPSEKEAA